MATQANGVTLTVSRSTACLLAAIFFVCGCTPGGASRRPIAPVTATVTYKGAPVADATVTFISEAGEPSAAFGKTDASGVTKPQTPELGEGVVLGKQKVTINKEQIVNQSKAADQESPDYAPPPPGGAPVPQVKDLVPAKYKAPGTTPLTVEVVAKGPNEFKLELTD